MKYLSESLQSSHRIYKECESITESHRESQKPRNWLDSGGELFSLNQTNRDLIQSLVESSLVTTVSLLCYLYSWARYRVEEEVVISA